MPAVGIGLEERIGLELRPAQNLAHRRPHLRLRVEIDEVVGATRRAGIGGARHVLAQLIAGALGHAIALMLAQRDADEVEHGVLHGHLDVLASAGGVALVDGGQDGDGHVHAGAAVADRRPVVGRRAVRKPRHAHGAAHGLRDGLEALEVGVGAVGAEALDGGIDQPRIDFLQLLPAKPHPVERARSEILDQHVGAGDQFAEQLLALVGLEVEGQAALVGVEDEEEQLVIVLGAGDIAAFGLLELDHVGPEKRQHLRARRARLVVRHVDDTETGECLVHAHAPLC